LASQVDRGRAEWKGGRKTKREKGRKREKGGMNE
jgi:hypothetical protein